MNNKKEINIGFSIIVPAFNAESTIEECLYSILEQTYSNYEIIVINDGSTDQTPKILNDIQSLHQSISIYNINNGGVSQARNFGLSKATKEYILFVDADDHIGNDYLSLFSYNLTYEDVFIISTFADHRVKFVDESLIERVFPTEKVIGELDSKEILGYLHAKCFKRDIIEKNEISFRCNVSFCEDLLFIQNYLLSVDRVFIFKGDNYHYSDLPNTLSKRTISTSQVTELIKSISSGYSLLLKRYPNISKELKENMNRRLVNVFFLFLSKPKGKVDFESFEFVLKVLREYLSKEIIGSDIKVTIKILFTKLNAKLSWCFLSFIIFLKSVIAK